MGVDTRGEQRRAPRVGRRHRRRKPAADGSPDGQAALAVRAGDKPHSSADNRSQGRGRARGACRGEVDHEDAINRRAGNLSTDGQRRIRETVFEEELFRIERQIIREFAARENCVIIGRAGSFVLREHSGVIRVFVHAPEAFRIVNPGKVGLDAAADLVATVVEQQRRDRQAGPKTASKARHLKLASLVTTPALEDVSVNASRLWWRRACSPRSTRR